MSKIGFFDSGFGGLTILKSVVALMPEYDYVYFGDTARVPYGNRSQEIIYQFTLESVEYLFSHGCDLVILACNTASSDALRRIQQEVLPIKYPNKKVLGVIIPACEAATEKSQNRNIGVIATESTVNSGAFERELKKIDTQINVYLQACPLLVPIVEAGEKDSEITELILKKYLTPLLKNNIDTLILGCTHYSILYKEIKKITNGSINLICEGSIVAEKLKQYLQKHTEIALNLGQNSQRLFLSTDLTPKFEKLGSEFFGQQIKVTKVELDYK